MERGGWRNGPACRGDRSERYEPPIVEQVFRMKEESGLCGQHEGEPVRGLERAFEAVSPAQFS